MKYWSIVLIFIVYNAKGQTLREWTAQNETALEYSRDQIRILGEGLGGLTRGYALLKKGLSTWNNIKGEESAAHAVHFKNREAVGPKGMTQVYGKEAQELYQLLGAIKNSPHYRNTLFSPSERRHVISVLNGMEAAVAHLIQSGEELGREKALLMNPGERALQTRRLESEWGHLKRDIIQFHHSNKSLIQNREEALRQRIQLTKWQGKK